MPTPQVPAPQCPGLPNGKKLISTNETALTSVKPPNISGAQNSETNNNSTLKDDLSNESDPVKLERKRKQQQKKEEFLQQLKRQKQEDGARISTVVIKSEQTSPVPEGSYLFVFNLIPGRAH